MTQAVGFDRDQIVARVLGYEVVGMCPARHYDGEWDLRPELPLGTPDDRLVYVEHCVCASVPEMQITDETSPEDRTILEKLHDEWRKEWEADQARWGHARACLRVLPEFSTDDQDAVAALMRWVREVPDRHCLLECGRAVWVELSWLNPGAEFTQTVLGEASTLADAITEALAATEGV